MIQEQAAVAVIIALISEKNKLREKRQKGRVCVKPWLKRRKELRTLWNSAAELHLEDEYNYNTLFTNDFWNLWRTAD